MSTALFLSSFPDSNHITCQLNQSPWDIITFATPPPSDSAPPPDQLVQTKCSDGNGNGALADYPVGALQSIGSLKLAIKPGHVNNNNVKGCNEEQGRGNLCRKTDGKPRQCEREAQKKNTMCINTLAHPSTNVKSSSNTPVRTRKPSTASNPNEFYYYSGFGPLWGKKRDLNKREKEAVEEIRAPVTLTLSSSSEIDDDNEGSDKEEKCVNGKKRMRKPIKARSLKDLCQIMG